MKFTLLCILLASRAFQVKSDSIRKLRIFANNAAQKILSYDQEFFNSLIQMLSNIKDLTTFSLFETWNSAHIQFNNSNKLAETNEQKECIASERRKLSEIIDGVASPLFRCSRYALEFGSPIRKKVQGVHKASRKILKDSQSIEDTCSSESEKQKDDCISFRVEELETSLKDLLQQLITFQIEGGTIKLTTLSVTLDCNAEVLIGIHSEVTNLHKRLKECVQ